MKEYVKTVIGDKEVLVYRDGKVVSCKTGRAYTWTDNGNGYKKVAVGFNGKTKNKYIHRLVAECFLPNPNNLSQVNHKDGDKENNTVENLEWVSNSCNIRHAHKAGLMDARRKHGSTVNRPESVLTSAYIDYKLGKSVTKSAEAHGMPRTTLLSIVNKRSHVAMTNRVDEVFMSMAS